MLSDQSMTIEDSDSIDKLMHAQLSPNKLFGNRVAIGVKVDVAFGIDSTLMKVVDVWNMYRKRNQRRLFLGIERTAARPDFAETTVTDPFAPFDELGVEVTQVYEGSSRIEVTFDIVKGSLDARRTVRVADFMRFKREAETLAQGGHGVCWHSVFPRATSDDYGRVVDHASLCGAFEVFEGFGQEDTTLEPGPACVRLGKDRPREAENQAGACQSEVAFSDPHLMRRRVVLHLLAGFEIVLADRGFGTDTNALTTAESRQRRVPGFDSIPTLKLLDDAHQVSLALLVEALNAISIRVELGRAVQGRNDLLSARKDSANRIP